MDLLPFCPLMLLPETPWVVPSFLGNQHKDHSDIPKQIHTVHVSINSKTGRDCGYLLKSGKRHWSSREKSPNRYERVSLRQLLRSAYAPSVFSRVEADNHNTISSRLCFSGKLLGSGSNAPLVMLLYFLPSPRTAVLSISKRDVLLKERCGKAVEMRKGNLESKQYIKKRESSQGVFNRYKLKWLLKQLKIVLSWL